ncbi:PDZ and LIM domain protein 7-like isoform X2 [Gigantopelta aegis]|uniref:PDZ and LIM domain protein 7-like isoform X2 n=1 Tax=Gigantopelta aegis TaxID=1735272 RepID=UPI001B88D363|nr:PDZ and LIM domain protein 7-like isoform X2 [Gigantopelta aegis]
MSVLTLEAKLERADTTTPWGFRMQGGKDFASSLTIQRVTPGSLAAKCGLQPGDVILKIGNTNTDILKHKEAQDYIVSSGNRLDLLLQRGGTTINASYEKFNTPSTINFSSSSPAQSSSSLPSSKNFNVAPKPFGAQSSPGTNYGLSNPGASYGVSSLTQKTQNMNISSPVDYQASAQKYAERDEPPDPSQHHSKSFKQLQTMIDSGQEPATRLRPLPKTSGRTSPQNAPAAPQSKTVKAILPQRYNTPIGLYSNVNVETTLQDQSKFLVKEDVGELGGTPGPCVSPGVRASTDSRNGGTVEGPGNNTKTYYPSETYKLIKEQESPSAKEDVAITPSHSRSFKYLQQQLDSGGSVPAAPKPATWTPSAPVAPAAPMAPVATVAKPWAPPGPAGGGRPGGAPPIPTGKNMFRGKAGDAVMRVQDATGTAGIPKQAMCASCGNQIRGPFVLAMGKSWCPDHFVCANPRCARKLIDIGFVEEGGFLYCEKDYELYFAPRCFKCGEAIIGECVNALSNSYHPQCFTCSQCRNPIGGNQFHIEDGKPYCEHDWAQMFQTMCFGCNFPIEPGDKWVEAMGQNFHSECFNCSTCQCNLEGQPFYVKSGKPFCKKHIR